MSRRIALGFVLTAALVVALYQVKERALAAQKNGARLQAALDDQQRAIAGLEAQLARSESEAGLAPAIARLDMVPLTVDREWRVTELRNPGGDQTADLER